MKASNIVNRGSQIHGNIETYNNLVFENCVVGDVDRFVVSYREDSSPVIFRNCVFNDNVMVVIETGNKTYIEVNDLEMDKGSVLVLKSDVSCIIEGFKMKPFSTFYSPINAKNLVMKDVIIRRSANIDLKNNYNPPVVYLNNVEIGEEGELKSSEVYDVRGSLYIVNVKTEACADVTLTKYRSIKGENLDGNVEI